MSGRRRGRGGRTLCPLVPALLLVILAGCGAALGPSPDDENYETGGGGFLMEKIFYSGRGVTVEGSGYDLLIRGPFGSIRYDTETGLADIFSPEGAAPVLAGVYGETEIGGRKVRTYALSRDEGCVKAAEIAGPFGPGVEVSVRNRGNGLDLVQRYYVYAEQKYLLMDLSVNFPGGTSTNYIAPVAGADAELEGAQDPRFLFVPFDNDEFVRYRSDPLASARESYEVSAVFDNDTRRGFVIGSVSHDVWKTGVQAEARGGNRLDEFRVFGGITSFETRDTADAGDGIQPHGAVSGAEIRSPKIFWGFFADWRDGMEEYGRANGIIAPPLSWDGGPPFGWNTWSAVADKLDYDVYVRASDFIKNSLPEFNNGDPAADYINFDAFWDRLSEAQRKDAAAHVRANGQQPGIYHTPFTYWGDADSARRGSPEGVNGQYTWYDLLLKDKNKKPLRYMHNKGLPLDPTHPGTVLYNKNRLSKFREWGFGYVKFDFMSHGAMEGVHFDKNITTGVQAYSYGLQKIIESLGDDIDGQKFFISLSIAPVFPASYAHGRRISCDVFGTIDNAEYMLNSLTYGWWLHKAVYPYNDPDHIVVYNSYNRREAILYNEGLTRYVSSAITGGFMIDSDDIRIQEARERAIAILNNQEINALAASGRTFRPVEGDTGSKACDIFVRKDEDAFYLAVFNLSSRESKTMTIDLARTGLEPGVSYRVYDLLSHQEQTAADRFTVTLAEAEPKVFKFAVRGE
jgi:hypothetical protein